jgi:hypothetical protein
MIGAVVGLAQGMMAASAEAKRASAQNKAADAADKYNLKAWKFNKKVLKKNYNYQLESVDIARSNAAMNALFTDAVNQQNWNYGLMIHNAKELAAEQQWMRSEQLYSDQINLNNNAARIATESQYRRLEELEMANAFAFQELAIETMQQADMAVVRGGTGRSTRKAVQTEHMKAGMDSAKLVESLTSGRRDVMGTLQEIAQDKAAGDLQAWAQKLTKPGKLPFKPKPFKTPIPLLQDPNKPNKYDYGPKPAKSFRSPDNSGLVMASAAFGAFGSLASSMMGTSASQTGDATYGTGIPSNPPTGNYASDIRLKENIIKVGKALSGLNIYEWNYKSAPNSRYRGVMAQEVAKIFPEAIIKESDGFLSVIYDLIDVNMELVT